MMRSENDLFRFPNLDMHVCSPIDLYPYLAYFSYPYEIYRIMVHSWDDTFRLLLISGDREWVMKHPPGHSHHSQSPTHLTVLHT